MKAIFLMLFLFSCAKSSRELFEEKTKGMTDDQLRTCARAEDLAIEIRIMCTGEYLERH